MADKKIGELPRASIVTTTDLFALEQAGQAKSLTGQVLMNDLATALDGHGGIKSIELNADYTMTITMADDTEVTTTSVRGETGAKGDKGTDGRAITSVAKTSTSGLVDTYTITFSDDTTSTFTVSNGSSIKSIAKTGTSGLVDTYTVTTTDNDTSTFTVTNGNGIASIALQSGNHAAGTTDTYKITFDNGEFTTFSVYNGLNGSGSVVSVNGVSPDASGNVSLTGSDVPAGESDDTTVSEAIANRQPKTNDLTGEATLADGDYFPFYDVSATANRKTPWSNIVSKIRSALFGSASGFLKANGSGVVSGVSTIGTNDISDGAVVSWKIATETILNANYAPGSITKNKLANDAKYLPFAERDSSASMYITSAWGGYLNYVVGDNDISIDSAEYGRLEDNWQADIISGNKSRVVAFTGIPIINVETGLISEAGGATVLPVGKTLRIKKTPNAMLVGGSFGTPAIYSGTADPTTGIGIDGDIYIQYSE